MKEVLRVEQLTHVYGPGTPFEKTAVDKVDFSARHGEFLALIGHTGSGKSTLIQHFNGLLRPTSGRVLINGEDIYQTKEMTRAARFAVGLVFQYPEYQLFEETVYADVAFGPKNMGLNEAEIDRRVHKSVQAVGLSADVLEKSPFALSGGQKRRVAIAGVMAMEPEVLILDEPTAGLDPRGCEDILSLLRDYHTQRGSTVVLVSHSMEEIARNAQRIIVLDKGGVRMQGTPAEVFARARELEAVGLDVPQVTKIAHALHEKGVAIDPAVYTVEALRQQLLALKGGCGVC